MPWQKPTIVLFDMDGTVIRHRNARLLEFMEKLDDMHYACKTAFAKLRAKFLKSGSRTKKPSVLLHRALHRLRRRDVDVIVEPCPHIAEVLDLLLAHDIPVGIVSNGLGKGYGHDILTVFNFEKYFRVCIFREDIARAKPDPDPLQKALEKLAIPIGEFDRIWYIGDRRKDILAAIALSAHVPCPVVPFGYGIRAGLAILEAGFNTDHIINDYHDFANRLGLLLNKPRPTGA